MNRKELDAFVAHYKLPAPAVRAVLEIAGARPSRDEELHFVVRGLLLAGVLSLAAGVIFFVAANWDVLRTMGRFLLLEAVFVAAIGIAVWKAPPGTPGRLAMLAAFIVAGALFALFGQTYQTGADVYELFLTWALIGLPLAFAGQWSVLWGTWVFVLNVALALYCGWQPHGGPLWWLFSGAGSGLQTSLLCMLAALLNLALWAGGEAIVRLRPETAAARQIPHGLRRFILACAVAFSTWAGVVAILGGTYLDPKLTGSDGLALALLAMTLAGVGFHAFRVRRDVFPVAMIVASLILIGAVALGRHSGTTDTALVLMLALWLAISSTIAGQFLMRLVRAWRTEAQAA